QYTEVIVRQTADLGRIVDEFSKFARMPEPVRSVGDLVPLVRDAVILQGDTMEGVTVTSDLPDEAPWADFDGTMISQAVINLIKNAGEAIESLENNGAPDGHDPRIKVTLRHDQDSLILTIADNGIGLPEDRSRLFEPYVTTRKEGTGLGLSIVKKIIEEHGGTLILTDATPLDDSGQIGAMAEIRLPKATTPQQTTPLKVAE
ncbi:MAG: ATP-binding protein, partial [Pseudomonadota bacterium]